MGEVVATVAEIDEALRHASLVSPRYRGPAWARFVDHLLDARLVVALRGP